VYHVGGVVKASVKQSSANYFVKIARIHPEMTIIVFSRLSRLLRDWTLLK